MAKISELETLVSEAIREEAALDLKRDRIKVLFAKHEINEYVTPAGAAKISVWTETKDDPAAAKELLDKKIFALLFPPKADKDAITSWAASSDENRALVNRFRTSKQSSPRLTLKPAK